MRSRLRIWFLEKKRRGRRPADVIPGGSVQIRRSDTRTGIRTSRPWRGVSAEHRTALVTEGSSTLFSYHCRLSVDNPKLFRNAFTHFVRQLNRKGLTDKTLVALDSSKFRAVNSKKNNYNQKRSTGNWNTSIPRFNPISKNSMPVTWMKLSRKPLVRS